MDGIPYLIDNKQTKLKSLYLLADFLFLIRKSLNLQWRPRVKDKSRKHIGVITHGTVYTTSDNLQISG